MQLKKNIKVGNKLILFLFIYLFSLFITLKTSAEVNLDGNKTDLKILDKIKKENQIMEKYSFKDFFT